MQAVLYAMAGVMAVAVIVAAAGLRRGIHAAADARGEPSAAGTVAAGEAAAGEAAAGQGEGSPAPHAGS